MSVHDYHKGLWLFLVGFFVLALILLIMPFYTDAPIFSAHHLVRLQERVALLESAAPVMGRAGAAEVLSDKTQDRLDRQIAAIDGYTMKVSLILALVAIVVTALTIGLSINLTFKDANLERKMDKAEQKIQELIDDFEKAIETKKDEVMSKAEKSMMNGPKESAVMDTNNEALFAGLFNDD